MKNSFNVPNPEIVFFQEDLEIWYTLSFAYQLEFLDTFKIPYRFIDTKGREICVHPSTRLCGYVLCPFHNALRLYKHLTKTINVNDVSVVLNKFQIPHLFVEEKSMDPIIINDGTKIEYTKGPLEKVVITELTNFFKNVESISAFIGYELK